MSIKIHTLAALVGLSLCQIGCALTKETIHINYTPRPNPTVVQGAANTMVAVTVKDRRADQTAEVARKINGFGSEMAPISNDEAIPILVETAIIQELTLREYRIGKTANPIRIELLGFSHKYNSGFFAGDSKASVSILVAVKTVDGTEIFEKTFADSFSHSIQIATGYNVKQAYEEALPGAIRKLMDDPDFHAALAKSALTKAPKAADLPSATGSR